MRSLITWLVSRSQLIASLILLTLALMAAAALVVYTSYRQAAADLLIERDRQLAYLSASRLKDELANLSSELTALAQVSEVTLGSTANRQAALKEAQNRLSVFDGGVAILDSFGKVAASHPPQPEIYGSDWSDHEYFRQQLSTNGMVISEMSNDSPDGAPVVAMSVPIRGERGEFAGAVVGMFRLGGSEVSSLYASIVRLRLDRSGNTYLVDGTGKILFDSAYEQVGRNFADSALSGLDLSTEDGALRTHDLEGNEVVAAYARVPGTNWVLVTEDDWATVTSATQRYANVMLGLIVAGILLPPLGVVLLARRRTIQTSLDDKRVHQEHVARLVQQELWPPYPPIIPGWQIELRHRRAVEGGGDFYDFLFLPDGRLMLALVDIADRELAGALTMTSVRASLRGIARQGFAPALALALANEILCPETAAERAIACLYVILDPANGRLEFANAGQPLPGWRKPAGAALLDPAGPKLGVALDLRWEQRTLVLGQGEGVVLYSDGLLNVRDSQSHDFGSDRLMAALEYHEDGTEDLSKIVFDRLEHFGGAGWTPVDDLTLIAVTRDGAPAER